MFRSPVAACPWSRRACSALAACGSSLAVAAERHRAGDGAAREHEHREHGEQDRAASASRDRRLVPAHPRGAASLVTPTRGCRSHSRPARLRDRPPRTSPRRRSARGAAASCLPTSRRVTRAGGVALELERSCRRCPSRRSPRCRRRCSGDDQPTAAATITTPRMSTRREADESVCGTTDCSVVEGRSNSLCKRLNGRWPTTRRPEPAGGRSGLIAPYGFVVESVNVSVLLYVPVRSGVAGADGLPEGHRHRVVADRAGPGQQRGRAGGAADRRERRAGAGRRARGLHLQRLRAG